MALNNQFKVKNDLNTLGSILSSGTDLLTIFAPSNTSWRLSAYSGNFFISGNEVLRFTVDNGLDVKLDPSTETVLFSGVNATHTSRGVASFTSNDFDIINGQVSIKVGGVDNNQLATASVISLNNNVVIRGASGEIYSGNAIVSNLSATGNATVTSYVSAQGFISTSSSLSAANNVQAGGFITAAGNLSAYGSIISNNDLTVNKNISAYGNIATTGTITANSSITTRANLSANGNLQVQGFITAGGSLSAYGSIVSDNDLTVNKNLSAYGNIAAARNVTVAGNLSAYGDIVTDRNLTVDLNLSAYGNIATTGNIIANNFITTRTNLSAGGNIQAGGFMTVNSNLSAGGFVVANNGFTTTGNISATGNITSNGYITTQSQISAFGVVTAPGGNSEQWNYGYSTSVKFRELSGSYALSAYNTTISDNVSSVAVGGATPIPASEWKTKTIIQALDTILFPDVAPTYTIATISIAFNSGVTNGTTYEVGTTVAPVLGITATKNDAGRFTSLLFQRDGSTISTASFPTSSSTTNIADQFGFVNPNSPNARYTPTFTDSYVLPTPSTTTWRAVGNYDAGQPKRNNKGVIDPRAAQVRNTNVPQAAETNFISSTISAISQYRRWIGSLDALPTSSNIRSLALTSSLDTNNSLAPIFIDKKVIVIAIPSSRTLTSVITEANENITANFTLSTPVFIPDAGGTNRQYKFYYIVNATPLNANLTTVNIS